jgi:serine/threonine protein kinase
MTTQPLQNLELSPSVRQLGKYRLVATLGQGGMGTVHLALASGPGSFRKLLALKELRRSLSWDKSSLAMFMDETQLAARLDHPNVLQTFEAGEDHGRHFLAMEYLDGQPLHTLLSRARQMDPAGLPLAVQLHILCEVLNGLQYAHDLSDYDGTPLNIVHRDVNPQNVFVTYHGQVKVVDFGLAKASTARNQTNPGVFKGKLAYAAPEQLMGRSVDNRCDVFAVGVMLWEAIARRLLRGSPTAPDVFPVRTGSAVQRIADVAPHVDLALAGICDRALAVDPERRFQTAAAFRRELLSCLLREGARIESADIAERMRALFEHERRVTHDIIERATMQTSASGSAVHALPISIAMVKARAVTALSRFAKWCEFDEARSEHETRPGYARSPGHKCESDRARSTSARRFWRLDAARIKRALFLPALAIAVFAGAYQLSRSATGQRGPRAPVTHKAAIDRAHVTTTRPLPTQDTGSKEPAQQVTAHQASREFRPSRAPLVTSDIVGSTGAKLKKPRVYTRIPSEKPSSGLPVAHPARPMSASKSRTGPTNGELPFGSDLRKLAPAATSDIYSDDPYPRVARTVTKP